MKRRKKRFNWALYENLRQIEREEAFRLLKWAVDSLPPPWDSSWKGVGRKPYDARALTVVTIWQEIEGKPERAYTADRRAISNAKTFIALKRLLEFGLGNERKNINTCFSSRHLYKYKY